MSVEAVTNHRLLDKDLRYGGGLRRTRAT